jgi:hypothetical protein
MRIAYCDLEQAESRVVGAICLRLFGDAAYLDACESGDLHTSVCRLCWTQLPWPEEFSISAIQAGTRFDQELLSAAKRVAGAKAYRSMSYRDLAKRLGHGSNYYGQPPTMAQHSHVDVKTISAFQRVYFTAFAAIRRWHDWVLEQIQTQRQLTTMLGRRIYIFKDVTAASTLREMIAYEPQSVGTGDYMNAGMQLLDAANYPLFLLKQVHDALAFEYDYRDEDWLIPTVCNTLSWSFPLTPHPDRYSYLLNKRNLTTQESIDLERLSTLAASPRPFSIPVEAQVGWNLGKYDEAKNPNGLRTWHPAAPDQRRRIASAPQPIADKLLTLIQGTR